MTLQEQVQITGKILPSSGIQEKVKKSWALMAIESEEEEEQERKEEIQKKLQAQLQIRRDLFNRGKYELEEGEILE
jgi:hypothetical protein